MNELCQYRNVKGHEWSPSEITNVYRFMGWERDQIKPNGQVDVGASTLIIIILIYESLHYCTGKDHRSESMKNPRTWLEQSYLLECKHCSASVSDDFGV